jgi:putative spermidine/putrescine transport system substrate-binding protein
MWGARGQKHDSFCNLGSYSEGGWRVGTYRVALVVSTVLASAALMSACGSSNDGSSKGSGSTAGSSSSSGSASLTGKKAVFVDFGGPAQVAEKKAYVTPVVASTGMKIAVTDPTDYVKLQTQVETGNVSWTVVLADPWWVIQNCGKLLEKRADVAPDLDISKIDPKFVTDDCTVPVNTIAWMPMYNAKKFTSDAPKSWSDFFNTAKYPGTRLVWGSYTVDGLLEGALLADGVKPENLYPLDVDRALKKLDTIRKDISFFDTIPQAQELMRSGEPAFAEIDSSAGYGADVLGANFKPVWGGPPLLMWNAYAVPKGADRDAAAPILKRIADPASQTQMMGMYPFGTTGDFEVPKPRNATFAEWQPDQPSNVKNIIPMDQKYWAENFDQVNEKFLDWVAKG